MFDLYTNFDVIFLPNLTDKIHYQIFDSLGRVVQVLVDNDGKAETGNSFNGNDGNQVNGIDSIESYKRNVKGEIIEVSYDLDADNTVDRIEHFELNANGATVKKYVNVDGKTDTGGSNTINGKEVSGIDRSEFYKLNARQDIELLERDINGDGNIDESVSYTYDGYRLSGKSEDLDNDGKAERLEEYTWDDRWKLTKIDFQGDGTWDLFRNEFHDGNDRVLLRYSDMDANTDTGYTYEIEGKVLSGIDYIYKNTYENGRLIKYEADTNGDGIAGLIRNVINDAYGREIARYSDWDANINTGYSYTVGDRNFEGIDYIAFRERDAYGREIIVSSDPNGDGIIDSITYNVYDALGRRIEQYRNQDGNKENGYTYEVNGETVEGITYWEKITYDDYDNAIRYDIREKGKEISLIRYYVYDINGNQIERYSNIGANMEEGYAYEVNGETVTGINHVLKTTYDANNQRIVEEVDNNGDGINDRLTYYVRNQNRVITETYIDGDGNPNTGYSYTINGEVVNGISNITKHIKLNNTNQALISEYDTNGDGIKEGIYYYERNNDGGDTVRYTVVEGTSGGYTYTINGEEVQNVSHIQRKFYSDAYEHVFTATDKDGDNNVETIAFSSSLNTIVDFTNFNEFSLGNALETITLGNTTASTSITLDKATIAAISQNGFQVRGDETDTVTLTDVTVAEKLDATRTISRQIYDQYQFEMEGNTYTLLVDSDISVVLG